VACAASNFSASAQGASTGERDDSFDHESVIVNYYASKRSVAERRRDTGGSIRQLPILAGCSIMQAFAYGRQAPA
jgi:hypothetical protein